MTQYITKSNKLFIIGKKSICVKEPKISIITMYGNDLSKVNINHCIQTNQR